MREAQGTAILISDMPSLDGPEFHVDGLIGQNFLSLAPYLVDYRENGYALGMKPVEKARSFGLARRLEFLSGRPLLRLVTDAKARPMRLILDSGVNELVLRWGVDAEPLLDEHAAWAVPNAGGWGYRKVNCR